MGQKSLNKPTVIAQCTEYSIKSFGGTEALVATLVRELSPTHQIILVSNDEPETIAHSEFAPLIKAHISWKPEERSAETSKNLARQLRAHGVDLAHFHFGGNYGWGNRALNQSTLLKVKRLDIPCISTNHGAFYLFDGYCASWRPLWLKLALLPAAWLSKMHAIYNLKTEVAVSQHDLRNLQRWYWPLRKKFRQIYHSKLQAQAIPEVGQRRKKVILCVGTIGFRKGQPVLCEAFGKIANRHSDWNLLLAGRAAEPQLMSEIEEIRTRSHLESRIQFVEDLSDEAIAELMRTSEIFAMPSLHEGLGLSLQEALFYGCVCIGSRVGGIPELIDDGDNGLLVSPGNAEELAAGLDRLVSDESLRVAFRMRGPKSILEKGMTARQMTQWYTALYQQVLEK